MRRRIGYLTLAVVIAVGMGLPAGAASSSSAPGNGPTVRVMTRNLYIGADIFRVAQADPADIPLVAAQILATVVETNFPERAQALADEIARTQPDLIGLQEVSLIRTQIPGDLLSGNFEPNATDVLFDYLAILMGAIEARGLNYEVGVTSTNADVELPFVAAADPLTIGDVRATDRDVILVRRGVSISEPTASNYVVNLPIVIGGLPVSFTRGWASVVAEVRGRTYRFVNTHLEVGDLPSPADMIQFFQASELAGVLSAETRPVILVGDFNATAGDLAYQTLAGAGFADAWFGRTVPAPGFTCCQEELLNNPVSALDERIDLVFTRGFPGGARVLQAVTVGDEMKDLTPSGLWPSDHAGVAAHLRFALAPD